VRHSWFKKFLFLVPARSQGILREVQPILTCICLMAGVPTEMTFNTTWTVMTSQCDNTMRHDNALPVTCHSRCASHRTMHMSYRSKTYTWNDVILVKRSMIWVFMILFCVLEMGLIHQLLCVVFRPACSLQIVTFYCVAW